jgi:hypothetical protein
MLIGAGETSGENAGIAGIMPFPGWVTVTKPGTTAAGATRAAIECPHQVVAEAAAVGAAALVAVAEAAAGAVKHGAMYLTVKFDGGMSDV